MSSSSFTIKELLTQVVKGLLKISPSVPDVGTLKQVRHCHRTLEPVLPSALGEALLRVSVQAYGMLRSQVNCGIHEQWQSSLFNSSSLGRGGDTLKKQNGCVSMRIVQYEIAWLASVFCLISSMEGGSLASLLLPWLSKLTERTRNKPQV